MVVVDTSVWVEFFRGRDTALVQRLRGLLDTDEVALAAPVRLELLAGARREEVERLRRVLSAVPLLLPPETMWQTLEDWVIRARLEGERFGALDLLIAGIANAHGAVVWSKDADFTRLARLGFVVLAQ